MYTKDELSPELVKTLRKAITERQECESCRNSTKEKGRGWVCKHTGYPIVGKTAETMDCNLYVGEWE